MAKTKVRKALAEQKALGIHMLYSDVCTFPVNPIKVANVLGYKVYKDISKENVDGYYIAEKKRIYLNTEQPMNRLQHSWNCAKDPLPAMCCRLDTMP